MFPRMTKHHGADEVLFKSYVSSTNTYEFGPLLAGREPELYVADCYSCQWQLILSVI